jgi:hypothetical protein
MILRQLVSYEFKNNLGLEWELSGQNLDDVQPRGCWRSALSPIK